MVWVDSDHQNPARGLTLIYSSNLCDVRTTAKKTRKILSARGAQSNYSNYPWQNDPNCVSFFAACVTAEAALRRGAQKPLFRFNYSSCARGCGTKWGRKASGQFDRGALPYSSAKIESAPLSVCHASEHLAFKAHTPVLVCCCWDQRARSVPAGQLKESQI